MNITKLDNAPPRETRFEKCVSCNQLTATAKKCGNCESAIYCTKNCQTADWPRHKTFCKAYTVMLQSPDPIKTEVLLETYAAEYKNLKKSVKTEASLLSLWRLGQKLLANLKENRNNDTILIAAIEEALKWPEIVEDRRLFHRILAEKKTNVADYNASLGLIENLQTLVAVDLDREKKRTGL